MKNSHGLDVDYCRRKLERVLRDLDSYTPDELSRDVARLARTVKAEVLQEPEFAPERRRQTVAQRQARLRVMDAQLEVFGRAWALDGDLLRCRACNSGQLASLSEKAFVHTKKCTARTTVEAQPWCRLVELLDELARSAA